MTGDYIKRFFMAAVVLNQLLRIYSAEEIFNYQDVNDWSKEYPACAGERQSPVNINTKSMQGEIKNPIRFLDHDEIPENMTLENNGHTVVITPEWSGVKPRMNGGPLNGAYIIDSFHFHWGPKNYVGSEHTIDEKKFTLEMHIVHYKEDYGSLEDASDKADGVSVIGVIFQINKQRESSTLNPVVKYLSKVTKIGEKISIPPFSPSIFNLNYDDQLITYSGSLTTPPCTENVTWLLTMILRKITKEQIEAFRQIESEDKVKHNVRQVQPLNNRKLTNVNGAKAT